MVINRTHYEIDQIFYCARLPKLPSYLHQSATPGAITKNGIFINQTAPFL